MTLQVSITRIDPNSLTTEQIGAFTVNEDDMADVAFQRFPDIEALTTVQSALSIAIGDAWNKLGDEVKREGMLRREAADARQKWEAAMAATDPDVLPQELNTPAKRKAWLENRGTRRFNDGGVALRKQLEAENGSA